VELIFLSSSVFVHSISQFKSFHLCAHDFLVHALSPILTAQDLLVASPALAAAAESLFRAHACWAPLFADGRVECTPDECGFQPPPVSRGPQTPAARGACVCGRIAMRIYFV
jgi:hypothetical protein